MGHHTFLPWTQPIYFAGNSVKSSIAAIRSFTRDCLLRQKTAGFPAGSTTLRGLSYCVSGIWNAAF